MSGSKMQDVVFLVFFTCHIISHQIQKVAVINDRHTYEASEERYLDRIDIKSWAS